MTTPAARAAGRVAPGGDPTQAAHLAAAAEVVNAHGPAAAGFTVRAGAAAKAAGIARSSLYRLWPSLGELADDVRMFCVTRHPDWRTAVVARSPQEAMGAVLAEATRVDPGFVAVAGRSLAASTGPSAFRRRVADDEAAWFDRFGAWLAGHLHHHDRRPAHELTTTDLAIAVTAITEGSIIQAAMSAGLDRAFWLDADATALAEVVDRLVDRLTVPGRVAADPPTRPPGPGAPSPWSDRQEAVLAEILRAAVELPFDHPDAPLAVRLVDLSALSRQGLVTERRLRQIWATPARLNGDLFAFQARRLRAECEQVATEALMTKLAGGFAFDERVLLPGLDAVIGAGSHGDAVGLFGIAFAVGDPHVSEVVEAEFAAWRQDQKVMFLALLHAFGLHLGEEVAIERFTWVVFSMLIGCMRLGILDPSILERTVGYYGVQEPLLGAGAHAIWLSQVELCTHAAGPHER